MLTGALSGIENTQVFISGNAIRNSRGDFKAHSIIKSQFILENKGQ